MSLQGSMLQRVRPGGRGGVHVLRLLLDLGVHSCLDSQATPGVVHRRPLPPAAFPGLLWATRADGNHQDCPAVATVGIDLWVG